MNVHLLLQFATYHRRPTCNPCVHIDYKYNIFSALQVQTTAALVRLNVLTAVASISNHFVVRKRHRSNL